MESITIEDWREAIAKSLKLYAIAQGIVWEKESMERQFHNVPFVNKAVKEMANYLLYGDVEDLINYAPYVPEMFKEARIKANEAAKDMTREEFIEQTPEELRTGLDNKDET